jgi:hypothetical protein
MTRHIKTGLVLLDRGKVFNLLRKLATQLRACALVGAVFTLLAQRASVLGRATENDACDKPCIHG